MTILEAQDESMFRDLAGLTLNSTASNRSDGVWAYTKKSEEGDTLYFSFNVFDNSVQTRLVSAFGNLMFDVTVDGAINISVDSESVVVDIRQGISDGKLEVRHSHRMALSLYVLSVRAA